MSTTSDRPTATPFHVDGSVTGGTALVDLAGKIDADNADKVLARLRRQLDDPAVDRLVADLAGLDFLGSAGLQILVSARRYAEARGKTFRIQHAQGFIAHVIEITGLTRYLTDPSYQPS